jgi:PAS domain S-box-containing protein
MTKTTEDLKKYKIFYEASSDALMTLEPPEWNFTSGNPAAVKLFGAKDEQEFISLRPWDFSPEKQPDGKKSADKAKEMVMKAMEEGSNFFEWTHKKYKGESFPATVLLTRVEIDGNKFLLATVRDISAQKNLEEDLRAKIGETEKLNELMTGRELKMLELKEKIKELEKNK